MSKKEKITLELTNNQAVHLWGILVGVSQDIRRELVANRVYKKDGTPNKNRKRYGDFWQERVDSLELSELIYKSLEEYIDFGDSNNRGQSPEQETA
jgi:hypothetical protein